MTGISSVAALQEIVKINHGSLPVYPNESEPVPPGSGLNVPAQVSLMNLFPPSDIELHAHVEEVQSETHTEFVSYRSHRHLRIQCSALFSYVVGYGNDYSTLNCPVSFRTNSQSKTSLSLSPIPTASSVSRKGSTISPRASLRSTRITQ